MNNLEIGGSYGRIKPTTKKSEKSGTFLGWNLLDFNLL